MATQLSAPLTYFSWGQQEVDHHGHSSEGSVSEREEDEDLWSSEALVSWLPREEIS